MSSLPLADQLVLASMGLWLFLVGVGVGVLLPGIVQKLRGDDAEDRP